MTDTLTIGSIGQQVVGTPFTINCLLSLSLEGYAVPIGLDASTQVEATAPIDSVPFSFVHPAFTTAGSYTLAVKVFALTGLSNTFRVVNPVVLTPTSGGSIKDASGNVWTLTATGAVEENGVAVVGGAGTAEFTIVGGIIYGQDAASKKWYSYEPASKSWDLTVTPEGV